MATNGLERRSRDLAGWPLEIKVISEGDSIKVAMSGEIDLATADEAIAVIEPAGSASSPRSTTP